MTSKVNASPRFKAAFIKFANAMGYGSPMQVAARRSFNMYTHLCVPRADEEDVFWLNGEYYLVSYLLYCMVDIRLRTLTNEFFSFTTECHLPPTFQSWFTIANLHVWLLTVRLRALPKPEADYFIQAAYG